MNFSWNPPGVLTVSVHDIAIVEVLQAKRSAL